MEEYDFSRLPERDKKRIKEESCYNQELDLWNSTRLDELNREDEGRKIMERMDSKNKS